MSSSTAVLSAPVTAARPIPARPRPVVAPGLRRLSVVVHAGDPVSAAGVIAHLRFRPELEVVVPRPGAPAARPDVLLVVADDIDAERLRLVRTGSTCGSRVVLVVARLSADQLADALDAGAAMVLGRREATPDALARAVRIAAQGDGSVAASAMTALRDRLGAERPTARQEPRPLVSDRELTVLRLLAEGCTTVEIARRMAYSERTIKNAIQDLMCRLQLRNRPHAVAYAVRAGLI